MLNKIFGYTNEFSSQNMPETHIYLVKRLGETAFWCHLHRLQVLYVLKIAIV